MCIKLFSYKLNRLCMKFIEVVKREVDEWQDMISNDKVMIKWIGMWIFFDKCI